VAVTTRSHQFAKTNPAKRNRKAPCSSL